MKTIKYIVQQGDTLWQIGADYNISWITLAKVNKLKNPDLIYPGDEILIPPTLWQRIKYTMRTKLSQLLR